MDSTTLPLLANTERARPVQPREQFWHCTSTCKLDDGGRGPANTRVGSARVSALAAAPLTNFQGWQEGARGFSTLPPCAIRGRAFAGFREKGDFLPLQYRGKPRFYLRLGSSRTSVSFESLYREEVKAEWEKRESPKRTKRTKRKKRKKKEEKVGSQWAGSRCTANTCIGPCCLALPTWLECSSGCGNTQSVLIETPLGSFQRTSTVTHGLAVDYISDIRIHTPTPQNACMEMGCTYDGGDLLGKDVSGRMSHLPWPNQTCRKLKNLGVSFLHEPWTFPSSQVSFTRCILRESLLCYLLGGHATASYLYASSTRKLRSLCCHLAQLNQSVQLSPVRSRHSPQVDREGGSLVKAPCFLSANLPSWTDEIVPPGVFLSSAIVIRETNAKEGP